MLFLAGCGTQVAGQAGESSASQAATGALPWGTVEPSMVTGARLADDHRTLMLDAQVPSGEHPCVRDLKAVLTDPVSDVVRVQITFSSPSSDRRSGCTEESTATARVKLPQPLGKREVVVDNYTQFTADGAKLPALRLCGQLGCRPCGHRLHHRLLRAGVDRGRCAQPHIPGLGALRREVAGAGLLVAHGTGLRRPGRTRLLIPAG